MSDASLNEQLLTALFDGELSGEERELAERILAENPRYAELASQWREQAAEIRKLPPYKLDDGFAFRVMREVLVPSSTDMTGRTKFVTNWRTGFAAIATLAAMLLLTLFVFPNISKQNSVALKTADEEEPAERETITPNQPMKSSSRPTAGSDEVFQIAMEGQAPALQDDSNTSGIGEIQSRSGVDYPRMKPGDAEGGMGGRPSSQGGSKRGMMKEKADGQNALPVAKLEKSSVVSSDVVAESLAEADPAEGMLSDPGNSFDQILVVEMPQQNQPFTTVEQVFARNSIEIVGPANQVMSEKEVVYNVISTPFQMKQAIEDLSKQANIAGYQLPANGNLMNLAQNVRGPGGQSESFGDANKSEGSSLDRGQSAAIYAADATKPTETAALELQQSASAQLLNSYRLGGGVDPVIRDQEKSKEQRMNEEVREIAELEKWFGLSANDSDSGLTRYLLLVRSVTTDAKGKAAKPANNSPAVRPIER